MMPSTPSLDQARHVGALVDGPGDDLEPERLCFRQRRRSQVAVIAATRPSSRRPTTSRGVEPPKSSMSSPAVQGEGPRLAALQGVAVAAIDGQADALDLRRDAAQRPASVRQSNDCMLTARGRAPPRAPPATTAAANVSGSGVSAPDVGVNLGLDVEADVVGVRPPRPDRTPPSSVGMRTPSMPPLLGKGSRRRRCRASGVRRRSACSSASVSERIAGPRASRNLPSGPRVWSGLRRLSWLTTRTPSLVMARSSSSVVTPIDSAAAKAASVFSGASPRAPRWPCRSNAPARGEA